MLKRAIAIVVTILSIISTIYSVAHYDCFAPEPIKVEPPKEDPMPINLLIDNQMSDLPQTEVFDRSVEAFMRKWELKGGSFALMRNDSLLYAKGYGVASGDSLQIGCNVGHVLRIASVSKLITASAIMKLIEDGRLSLDSQVFGREGVLCDSLFLDFETDQTQDITVEHLLRHTAGFSAALGDPAFANHIVARMLDKSMPITTDDMVQFATRLRLRSRPGGRFDYSNLGYIVLGKVIEKVSGESYEAYVTENLLNPAGCYDIHIGSSFSENHRLNEVDYFEVKEAELIEAYDGSGRMVMSSNGGNNIQVLGAAGGWVASPVELLRFVAAINGCEGKPDILSKESIAIMTDPSEDLKPIGWAAINGDEWLRSGSMAGTCALIKHQANGYTWVFVSNTSAWIGPLISRHISTQISAAVAKVDEWPARDLFEVTL